MEIEKVMIPIEKIINNSEECFAHVAKDNKQKETLKEHTERCQKYWKNLVEKKNLTEILEEFEKCYFNSTDEKVKEIFESMTVNIVTMHDIGKVNPEFQKEKMDHLWHRDVPLNDKVGSKHSIISSVFYLDYYIGIINLAVKNETIYKSDGEKLKDFAYIYSYIISRHHGDLTELERYLESLNGKQAEGDELGYQAGNWYELWKKSIMKQGDPEKIRKNWKRMLNRLNGDKDDTEKIIYLYCLTRLLYSLLVAADYYATTEYMNGFEMTDFGELNQWEHIIDIYEKSKVQISIRKYGKENYPIQPEKLLKEENINILRTEMFLDAERTLEKNMDKSIFYLEAPTGSGKSNTAMNLSLKMVQENEKINKIFYIYPFNTLVEQNMESMEKVFGQDKEIMSQIAIVNSLVPLKKNNKAEEDKEWNKILLDRQEQFMGRINRSGKKEGVVYFFNMDDASVIYKNDVRIEKDKTLENEEIRQLLLLKNFPEFYETRILPSIKKEGEKINDKNLEEFFCDKVALLNMPEVAKRMRLIDDNRQMISVYLGRILQNEKGEKIDGRVLWQEYKGLIEECKLEYAEKKIKLHDIRSQMNGFIYQFSNQIKLQEDEQIGDIFFIENGERYFDENGVLMKELFEDNTDLFI